MPSVFFQGGTRQALQMVVPLGTGAVSTQTKIVAVVPKTLRVTGIRYHGQAAVTGTSLTAQVFARTTAGGSGNSLQSAATSVAFGSAAAALAGVAASLTTTAAHLRLVKNQVLEVVITASGVTAGPGDLIVAIEFSPRGIATR